jgi:hypothetical protein
MKTSNSTSVGTIKIKKSGRFSDARFFEVKMAGELKIKPIRKGAIKKIKKTVKSRTAEPYVS